MLFLIGLKMLRELISHHERDINLIMCVERMTNNFSCYHGLLLDVLTPCQKNALQKLFIFPLYYLLRTNYYTWC